MFRRIITGVMIFVLSTLLFAGCGIINDKKTEEEQNKNMKIENQKDKIEPSSAVNQKAVEKPQNIKNEPGLLKSFRQKIHSSLPEYTFKLYGKKEKVFTNIKKIAIYDDGNERNIQELIIDGSQGPSSDEMYGVYIEDVNFDNYMDIRVQGIGGSGPNTSFFFWLWDKDSSMYKENIELGELVSPEIDQNNKLIKSSNSSSAGAYYTESVYKYVDGKLTLIKETERVLDTDKMVYHFTIKEMVGSKMKVVKEYDKSFEE